MLLIYTPRLTNRLGYTLNLLLRRLLRTDFSITTDEAYFLGHGDAKLCYGPRRVGDGLYMKSCNLLYETTIEEQEPRPTKVGDEWLLFPTYGHGSDFAFDLLSATFFMASRYEEYLPFRKDAHGRFTASESLAQQAGFLRIPVVERWAAMLRQKLGERYPDIDLGRRSYRFVQTVDIDAAWCYLHKGLPRTMGGIARDALHSPSALRQRMRVLTHRQPDPYDTFDYIIEQRQRTPGSHLVFFPLLADYSSYDKPISHRNPHLRDMLQHLGDHAKIGIHPGYYSIDEPHRTDEEIQRLEEIIHRTIVRSRFHYLRMQLPHAYRILMHAGIRHDYSMGYADAIGFRAGLSVPYPFYDLERDAETELTIHPFCAMDTTLHDYLHLSPTEATAAYAELIGAVREVGGDFCCIVHNQNLSEADGWQGWRAVYEKMLDMAQP